MKTVADNQAWLNGKVCDQRLIHDRGLMYGDGFFTTMLCYQQRLLNESAHWLRINRSAVRLGFPALDKHKLSSYLAEFIKTLPELAVVKLVITRGHGAGYAPPVGLSFADLSCILQASHPPEGLASQINPSHAGAGLLSGLNLIRCQTPISLNPCLAGIKHLNRLDNVLARGEVVQAGADEGLMVDGKGQVYCGTQSNIVLIKQQQLITPVLDQAGVEGTCLQSLPRALAESKLDYTWHYQSVSVQDVLHADAVFMCNAVRGIQPIKQPENTHEKTTDWYSNLL
jgi:4-amino-4-deoxychorismate lyase